MNKLNSLLFYSFIFFMMLGVGQMVEYLNHLFFEANAFSKADYIKITGAFFYAIGCYFYKDMQPFNMKLIK